MAKRNTLRFDASEFKRLLVEIEGLGGDVQKVVEDALRPAGEKIHKDTEAAMANSNLPAGGKFSQGDTLEAVVTDNHVEWEGMVASIPVGFDFGVPGAGGFLITGTPRMSPNRALNKMYKQKKYMKEIQNQMGEVAMAALIDKMTGG